jgi:SAM-dependent methyltransferase
MSKSERGAEPSQPVPGSLRRDPGSAGAGPGEDIAGLAWRLLGALRAAAAPAADRSLHDTFETNQVLSVLDLQIERSVDVPRNRLSRACLRDLFCSYTFFPQWNRFPVAGQTVVELGCGSLNPLSLLLLYVLAGARRGIGVDLDPVQDVQLATRALCRTASYMLLDPRLVVGDYPVSREQAAAYARPLDFMKLLAGDPGGLDPHTLTFANESAASLGLGDGEVDRVLSNSFLEHVPDPRAVIAEMARVTRPGGLVCHHIDGTDHRSHVDPRLHSLAFLQSDPQAALVGGCNRIRPRHYCALLEQHGFQVLHTQVWLRCEVDDRLRSSFVEPYRSMPREDLEVTNLGIWARRR